AAAGCVLTEVALLEQKDVVAAGRGVDRRPHSGGAPANHDDVPALRMGADTTIHFISIHGCIVRLTPSPWCRGRACSTRTRANGQSNRERLKGAPHKPFVTMTTPPVETSQAVSDIPDLDSARPRPSAPNATPDTAGA